jgi:sugar lactone lactonase YvrE
LKYPTGVYADASENLFIADYNNHRIRKVDAVTKTISTLAGNGSYGYSGDDGPAVEAMLAYPHSVYRDASGNLFIADSNNHCIRKVNSSGIITTVAGNGTRGYSGDDGPAIAAMLNEPISVLGDALGNLFITDRRNNRIRKVNASGIITTIAGNGTYGYSGDGGPAIAAKLNYPHSLFGDASGNLFIVDESNHRIRKLTPYSLKNAVIELQILVGLSPTDKAFDVNNDGHIGLDDGIYILRSVAELI